VTEHYALVRRNKQGQQWGRKIKKNRNFSALDWSMAGTILLDIETSDEGSLFGWAIYCVRSRGDSAIWWFRL